jgi:hypothetical protein
MEIYIVLLLSFEWRQSFLVWYVKSERRGIVLR